MWNKNKKIKIRKKYKVSDKAKINISVFMCEKLKIIFHIKQALKVWIIGSFPLRRKRKYYRPTCGVCIYFNFNWFNFLLFLMKLQLFFALVLLSYHSVSFVIERHRDEVIYWKSLEILWNYWILIVWLWICRLLDSVGIFFVNFKVWRKRILKFLWIFNLSSRKFREDFQFPR